LDFTSQKIGQSILDFPEDRRSRSRDAIITFDSTHFAIDSERILLKAGLEVKIMGRPIELGADCGFCLRIDVEYLHKALSILNNNGLSCQGIYLKEMTENGQNLYSLLWTK
jgi:hypothetical protein